MKINQMLLGPLCIGLISSFSLSVQAQPLEKISDADRAAILKLYPSDISKAEQERLVRLVQESCKGKSIPLCIHQIKTHLSRKTQDGKTCSCIRYDDGYKFDGHSRCIKCR